MKTGHHLKKNFLHFFPTPKVLIMPSVGIDISDSSVKFLELEPREYGMGIKRYGERKIPVGTLQNGEIKELDKLAEVLKSLKKDGDFNFIRASLPEEKAYIFKTTVPKDATSKEIRSLIEFRLEENVPISPAEAIFDYDVATEDPEKKHRSVEHEVSVVVYPRETVQKYTDVFRKAALTPLSFEIEAQAIARAVIIQKSLDTYMIVDFGKMRTGLAIVSQGLLSFTSTLDVVGDTLTDAIAKHFSVSIVEAERIKNESNFIKNKDNSELFVTLMETISKLKGEVERHYRYWNTRTDDRGKKVPQIDKIILCGGSSNVVGLREYLSGSLKIKTERANVWINTFSFEDVIPEIDYPHSLGYATAVGLALRTSI